MMNNNETTPKINSAIHIFLLLLLVWVVILYIKNSELLLADNYFVKSMKYLTNITFYKTIILSYSDSNETKDLFLSSLYIIFAAMFTNVYFASRRHENVYMQSAAFNNRNSFSGVIASHIYAKLLPSIYPDGSCEKYSSNVAGKKFNEFLLDQLSNQGAKTYFLFFGCLGFIILPLLAVYLTNLVTNRLVSFWVVSVLMVYAQVKVIFEVFLICEALTHKE